MTFISYAQNFEDVMLWRVFRGIDVGFYIDVGANDPDQDSVTKNFYDRGWRGINIEPVAAWHTKLSQRRPRDVNLQVAISATPGDKIFYEIENTGLSTLIENEAQRAALQGWQSNAVTVKCMTLDEVWSQHVSREVQFLKIDVEGGELDVLRSLNLTQRRPWILVVEATRPLSQEPAFELYEGLILSTGYRYAYFDGLNRFYIADEHFDNLSPAFSAPPNIFDNFIRFTEHRAYEEIARLRLYQQNTKTQQNPAPHNQQKEQRIELTKSNYPFLDFDKPTPSLISPGSQLCTANQFDEPIYADWCDEIQQSPRRHRKQWEFVYILEVLKQAGMLTPGKRGLGFGCGQEPIPAILARHGCSIVATDLETKDAVGKGWIETGQHARQLADLNQSGICPPDQFAERVTFRPADMNAIDEELRDFDFIWSSCAFEHLGSISHGLNFVLGALACLRPGGIAVHTTEFNITSNFRTIESRDLSIFRRHDIDRLGIMLAKMGADLLPVNYNPGTTPLDQHFDIPPYRDEPHLKLRLGGYVITSIGLVIRKR